MDFIIHVRFGERISLKKEVILMVNEQFETIYVCMHKDGNTHFAFKDELRALQHNLVCTRESKCNIVHTTTMVIIN